MLILNHPAKSYLANQITALRPIGWEGWDTNLDVNHGIVNLKGPVRQAEVKTVLFDAQGGVQRFGGWNNAGHKGFNDLVKLIEANRWDRKKYLTQVETEETCASDQ